MISYLTYEATTATVNRDKKNLFLLLLRLMCPFLSSLSVYRASAAAVANQPKKDPHSVSTTSVSPAVISSSFV